MNDVAPSQSGLESLEAAYRDVVRRLSALERTLGDDDPAWTLASCVQILRSVVTHRENEYYQEALLEAERWLENFDSAYRAIGELPEEST